MTSTAVAEKPNEIFPGQGGSLSFGNQGNNRSTRPSLPIARYHPSYVEEETSAPTFFAFLENIVDLLPHYCVEYLPRTFSRNISGLSTETRNVFTLRTSTNSQDLAMQDVTVAAPSVMGTAYSIDALSRATRVWPNAPLNALPNIARRLASFKNVEHGWADGMQPASQWGDGYGKAPNASELDWLTDQFALHYTSSLPQPRLYPTPEGGVQAEWLLGQNDASLEIDLGAQEADWHCLNLATREISERHLDLNCPSSWEWLVREIRRLESVVE
ncbi:MAG: hypothetical protein M2R45_00398 [Verrucomicrobia subdivision 3 bacterium]|nr:hypothetical protein [Limisphaerales bacterium]MCS1412843.1 hypothetical protein [Limisphaerales bacterium]